MLNIFIAILIALPIILIVTYLVVLIETLADELEGWIYTEDLLDKILDYLI
jgi:hypothetical protein